MRVSHLLHLPARSVCEEHAGPPSMIVRVFNFERYNKLQFQFCSMLKLKEASMKIL